MTTTATAITPTIVRSIITRAVEIDENTELLDALSLLSNHAIERAVREFNADGPVDEIAAGREAAKTYKPTI